MNRMMSFVGIAGLVLLLFGLTGGFVIGFQQPLMLSHMALGAVLLVLWLFISGFKNLGQAPVILSGRNARFGVNVTLYTVVFVGILVAVNWFANRYNKRWDFTAEGVYSLSEQSVSTVSALEKPVQMVAFIGQAKGTKERDLLELYALHSKNKVEISFVDPNSKPHLIEKYKLSGANKLYIAYGEADSPLGESRLDDITEESVTNAVIKLTRGAAKKIYYVVGHDEPAIDDEGKLGLKLLAQSIQDEHLNLEKIFLAEKGQIPNDAAAVMLVSPKKPILDQEKKMLTDYVSAGGRLLMFHDPSYPQQSGDITELAKQYGIEVGNNLVIDQVQRLFAGPALGAQPVARSYGSHAITRSLSQEDITIFNMASTVKAATAPDGAQLTELVKTGSSAWGENNLEGIFASSEPTATFDPSSDQTGPVSLAVAYEKKLTDPSKTAEQDNKDGAGDSGKSSRVIVFGDSDWILNMNLHVYANRDLVLNALNWLAGEEGGVTVRPKSIQASAAPIEESTFMFILALSFIVPELLLLGGLFVWWRRRTIFA